MSELKHTLVVRIDDDASLSLSVECPYTDENRPCGTWVENADDEPCICECDPCRDGYHEDCEEDHIENVGNKWRVRHTQQMSASINMLLRRLA